MDTIPLEQDLLHHHDFLLRLAVGLVGKNDAEDLVQDVWAKTLQSPPPRGGNVRGWLARVTRNLAVSRFRSRCRRKQRERARAGAEGGPPGVEAVLEHFELTQQIAAAVRELDEPYRSVILLRFFEGLDHASIAARVGGTVATVRTRQQRGLAKLRERLDRELGGREAWGFALGAWLARQGLTASATIGAGLLLGAAAALVAAIASVWYLARDTGVEEPVALSDMPAAVGNDSNRTASVAPGLEPRPSERQALNPEVDPPRHRLMGRAIGLTAEECRATRVEVDAEWPYAIDPPPVRGSLDEDGRFELPVDELLHFAEQWSNAGPPREWVVLLDHPVHLRLSVRVPFSEGVSDTDGKVRHDAGELAPIDAAVLRGSVRSPDDAPAAGAVVAAFPLDSGQPREFSAGQTECDSEGAFDLRLERGGEYALAIQADELRPGQVFDVAVLGEAHDLGTVTLESGVAISGRALRLGRPMPSAEISIRNVSRGPSLQGTGPHSIAWVDGRIEWSSVHFRADEDGAFRVGGLVESEYELQVAAPAGCRGILAMSRDDLIGVRAPAAGLALEFGASLVTIRRSSGSPADIRGQIHVARDGAEPVSLWFRGASDATFVAPPDTPLSLSVELEGLAPIPFEIVTAAPGEELVRTLSFADPAPGAALELQLVPDSRLALDALRVYFESPQGERRFDRGFAQDEIPESGLVLLEDLAPGLHRVRVHAGWDHLVRTPAFDSVLELELHSGETAHARVAFELGGLLRVDVRDRDGARRRAQFRLLDADGGPIPMTFHARNDNSDFSGDWYLPPFSTNQSETLAVGDYELILWDDGFEEQRLPVRIVAGETTELAVTLRPR